MRVIPMPPKINPTSPRGIIPKLIAIRLTGRSIFSQPQSNRWKTPIGLLLVPFQRRFSQYKFAVKSISPRVEEQPAPEL
jgi:hypothetical protein